VNAILTFGRNELFQH